MSNEAKKRKQWSSQDFALLLVWVVSAILFGWTFGSAAYEAFFAPEPPIAKATGIGGRPARYDDKAKAWVLTDEKDLTVEEEQ